MLIAAPDKGGTPRNPSCVKTNASPKKNAEPNARMTAALFIRIVIAVLPGSSTSDRGYSANNGMMPHRFAPVSESFRGYIVAA